MKIYAFIWEVLLILSQLAQEFVFWVTNDPFPLRLTKPKFYLGLEYRDGPKEKMEVRSFGEIRGVIDEVEGIVEAYLTKWDTVDDYNSTFKRGSFKKTLQERGARVKLIFNHQTLCGKVLEAREDDKGPWVKVKFNLETRAGQEAFAHVKAEDVTCFSFGFKTVRAGVVNGVREIREIKLFEVGPVVFEANSEANIESFRSLFAGREDAELDVETMEKRAEDFNETMYLNELYRKGYSMIMGLEETIYDIWWNNSNSEEVITKLDKAISDFGGMYLAWAQEYMGTFWVDDEARSANIPINNELQLAMLEHVGGDKAKVEDFAKRTSLTIDDLEKLIKGKTLPIDQRSKLDELPEPVRKAHHSVRRTLIENLATELRAGGNSEGERTRFAALLGIIPENFVEKRECDHGHESLEGDYDSLIESLRSASQALSLEHRGTEDPAANAATSTEEETAVDDTE